MGRQNYGTCNHGEVLVVETDAVRSPRRTAESVGSECICSDCLRDRYIGRKHGEKGGSQSEDYHHAANQSEVHQSKI